MQISIEISLYPLDKNYASPILDFIDRLKMYTDIRLNVQPMSTFITGDFDVIMDMLKKELKITFITHLVSVGVIKIVNLSLYDR